MYDIIYIGNTTDNSFVKLKEQFPLIKCAKSVTDAAKKTFTKMYWIVWNDLCILDNFKFDYIVPEWDLDYIHVFKNGSYFDGVCLFPKDKVVSNREIEHRFFISKKEIDLQASKPNLFDIIFISYKEPNAEANFNKLLENFPNVKRVHGVKGIHQAHIEAAKLSSTDMFWVVDGDAEIKNNFNFDYQVAAWDKNCVHVWKSQNPITKLSYGYGGVKLLPKKLTLNMDITSVDMTTSISTKFKTISKVSNITAFNTDPYNTWKSAFRECVKLSSKAIKSQDTTETNKRLSAWCKLNSQVKYGEFAQKGALAGKAYGEKNASNKEALDKINDFKWLEDLWLMEISQQ